MGDRFEPAALETFARALFVASGLDHEKAEVTARILLEADLLGHTTHGLQLADSYLDAVKKGDMTSSGEPTVVQDSPAALTLDGQYLPGPWLTELAIGKASERARKFGLASTVVRRSSHIGCLAAYLEKAAAGGQFVIIASSDPAVATVAPFGGREAVYTPDPIAIGFPTDTDPVIIDISASITTNGMCARLAREGKPLPHAWVLDSEGNPSTDPNVVTGSPPGTILPIGGLDHGHKGYGFALMIEAMTQGLAGFGRANSGHVWGASVMVLVFEPALFGGSDGFVEQTGWLRRACTESAPRPDVDQVRLPGQAGLARKREAMAKGVRLHEGILANLEKWSSTLGVPKPEPLAG